MSIGVGIGEYTEYAPTLVFGSFYMFTYDDANIWVLDEATDTWSIAGVEVPPFVEYDQQYFHHIINAGNSGDLRASSVEWTASDPDPVITAFSVNGGVSFVVVSEIVEIGSWQATNVRYAPNGDIWAAMTLDSYPSILAVNFYKSVDKGQTWTLEYAWTAAGAEEFRGFFVTTGSLYIMAGDEFGTGNAPFYRVDLADIGSGQTPVTGIPIVGGEKWSPQSLLAFPASEADVAMVEFSHYFDPIVSPHPTDRVSLFRLDAGVATDVTDPTFPTDGAPTYDTEFQALRSIDGVVWIGKSFGNRSPGDEYFMRTTDGGATWTLTPLISLGDIQLRSDGVALRKHNDEVVYGGTGGVVERSNDFGDTWNPIGRPTALLELGGFVKPELGGDGGGGSGGPVVLFLRNAGGWIGLLASDEITWEFRTGAGGFTENGFATDTDNIENIEIEQQGSDSDTHRHESTDGANNWTTDTDVGALPGLVNAIVFLFRDGLYRIQVFGDGEFGDIGGEYSSPDGLAPWTLTGRVLPRFFQTTTDPAPIGGDVWPADIWCATEDHAYYVLREDNSFAGLWRSIYVDTEVATAPQTDRLEYHPTDPPTGGTFVIVIAGGESTDPIAWDASAATILTELQTLTGFGAGGSASGSFATHILITYPFDGVLPVMEINPAGLSPGTADILTSIETLGQAGVGTFVTDPSVGSPVYGFNEMWGSRTGDVALVYLNVDDAPELWKLENTAAPVNVTPGFVASDDDSFDKLISPDSVTWLGVYSDGEGGSQLMRSADSGDTWVLVGPAVANIIHVVFDPLVAEKWWALLDIEGSFTEGQLYVSEDDGATWADFGANPYFFSGNEQIVPLGGRFN